ncbi:MAG TPA: DUF4149 domain-containing protein [Dehalococcoidia bacterium]|nr:DUF4149 domain-containing protein [Dehalococcoidia bacterium]
MGHAFTVWLHLLAVTIWIGPQFFVFIAALPAIREIGDRQLRAKVMRIVVTRFGYMAWAALVVIVLTGISNIFQTTDDFPYVFDYDYRYAQVFSTKMTVLGITVLLTAIHTFIVGPRQMKLAEDPNPDEVEVARLRRTSMILSSLALLGSVTVLFLGALLTNHEWSFQPV